jgi:hypothetical protein
MAENSLENTNVINNGDGITLSYIVKVLETSFFAVVYALQSNLNEKKLYRKNYTTCFFQSLLDYIHVIPFLVHGKLVFFSFRVVKKLI